MGQWRKGRELGKDKLGATETRGNEVKWVGSKEGIERERWRGGRRDQRVLRRRMMSMCVCI